LPLPSTASTRLTIVTFCFLGIRKDRPDDYYVRPLREFVDRLSTATVKPRLEIYANSRAKKYLARLPFGNISYCEPEELMSAVWDDPAALDVYQKLIRHNPTHRESAQARFRRLTAVWLGKVEATRRAIASGAEACFWFDAGHWVSYQSQHNFSRYRSKLQDIVRPEGLSERLLEAASRFGRVGQHFEGSPSVFHMPIEWMFEHAKAINPKLPRPLPFYSATLWLVHKRCMNSFFNRMRHWWLYLIEHKQAGVDENALTMTLWEQNWQTISYEEWVKVLGGAAITPAGAAEVSAGNSYCA
jgi:hypothetical protein